MKNKSKGANEIHIWVSFADTEFGAGGTNSVLKKAEK
jgi:hypothetical protein